MHFKNGLLQKFGVATILSAAVIGCQTTSKTPAAKYAAIQAHDLDTVARVVAEGQVIYANAFTKPTIHTAKKASFNLALKGDFRAALRSASIQVYLGKTEGNLHSEALGYTYIGFVYGLAGRNKLAEKYAKHAISTIKRAVDIRSYHPWMRRRTLGISYKILGDKALREKNYKNALLHYQTMLDINKHPRRSWGNMGLAQTHLAMGNHARAEHLVTNYIDARRGKTSSAYSQTMRLLGRIEMKKGDIDRAVEYFEKAIGDSKSGDKLFDRAWSAYELAKAYVAYSDVPKALRYLDDAAEYANKMRAQFHSEEWATGFFGQTQEIFDFAVEMNALSGNSKKSLWISELGRSRALLDLVRQRPQVVNKSKLQINASAKVIELGKLVESLPADTIAIQYHVLDKQTLAWVITRDEIRHVILKVSGTEIRSQAAILRNRLSSGYRNHKRGISIDAIRPTGKEDLYKKIIAPLNLPKRQNLVVIPHKELNFIPFQALNDGKSYLIERYSISYAPSLNVLYSLLTNRKKVDVGVYALGNPNSSDPGLNLPSAEVEVRNIRQIYPSSKVVIRDQATKANLTVNLNKHGILHLASHAEVDTLDPLYSKILLTDGKKNVDVLEAHEFYNFDLSGVRMVLLSACDTGRGVVTKGDEQWGFVRSILASGARSTMLSLWPVVDNATAVLMGAFYKELANGKNPSKALQNAQIKLLKSKKFSKPIFWAPFKFVGDYTWTMPSNLPQS